MVDPDALRLIALRMFDQGNAAAWRTLETSADEIEALRMYLYWALDNLDMIAQQSENADEARALLKGTPDNGQG